VLNEVLSSATGLQLKLTNTYDTDLLGIFTLDVPRHSSQLDAARKKAQIGMELLVSDIGLASKMNSLCPACQMPGYWIEDIQRGMPTDQEVAKKWGCLKCQHSDLERMKVLRFANPSQCKYCNP